MIITFAANAAAKMSHSRRNYLEMPKFYSAFNPAAVFYRPLQQMIQIVEKYC
jgi:hypothetical protein